MKCSMHLSVLVTNLEVKGLTTDCLGIAVFGAFCSVSGDFYMRKCLLRKNMIEPA